jgi:hypothetical protein
MATPEEVAELRLLIDEPVVGDPYTDEYLGDVIDDKGSLQAAALYMWGLKAARYSSLVDMAEGTSSRKMSDMMDNALKMRQQFASAIEDPVVELGYRTGTRAIERA